MFSYLF